MKDRSDAVFEVMRDRAGVVFRAIRNKADVAFRAVEDRNSAVFGAVKDGIGAVFGAMRDGIGAAFGPWSIEKQKQGVKAVIVSFISLGCDKNRVNTEQMMALCLQEGITVQEDCNGSDVVVINTCGFIDSAKSEAIDTILAAAELKAAGEIKKILVTGCLSQRYQADILEELP